MRMLVRETGGERGGSRREGSSGCGCLFLKRPVWLKVYQGEKEFDGNEKRNENLEKRMEGSCRTYELEESGSIAAAE